MSTSSKTERRNFTTDEKNRLVDLVTPHKRIVDTADKDSETINSKRTIWKIITTDFNSVSGAKTATADQLKNCWRNMKETAKKKSTSDKQSRIKTGGGTGKRPLDELSAKVASVCADEFKPLFNPHDSDAKHHGDTLGGGGRDGGVDTKGYDSEVDSLCQTPNPNPGNYMLSKRSRSRSKPAARLGDVQEAINEMRKKEHEAKMVAYKLEVEANHYKKMYYVEKYKAKFAQHPPLPPSTIVEVLPSTSTKRANSSVEEVGLEEEDSDKLFEDLTKIKEVTDQDLCHF